LQEVYWKSPKIVCSWGSPDITRWAYI